jgi:hypothetical protein
MSEKQRIGGPSSQTCAVLFLAAAFLAASCGDAERRRDRDDNDSGEGGESGSSSGDSGVGGASAGSTSGSGASGGGASGSGASSGGASGGGASSGGTAGGGASSTTGGVAGTGEDAGGASGAGGDAASSGTGSDAGDGGTGNETACPNLALTATATAETTFPGYSAANAIDGDRSTALGELDSWANDWEPPTIAFPQWFDIELGGEQSVARVDVYTTNDYRMSEYDLSVRAGGEWVLVAAVTANTNVLVSHAFSPVMTDAVRILVKRGPEHQFNHARLNEVEIYASADSCP